MINLNNLLNSPEEYGITLYEWAEDGLLNCYQDVDLSKKGLTELPFKFGKVTGVFYCSSNYLTTMEGFPTDCQHIFANNNHITHIPEDFKQSGLLDLGNNLIEIIPKNFKQSGHLFLSNNLIKEIPKCFIKGFDSGLFL